MSTAEAMANLSELSSLSRTLNEKSNRLNELLRDIEKKFVEMNLGVEAWVTIKDQPYIEENDDSPSNWSVETQIGFADWNGIHKLLVRRVHFQEISDNYGNAEWKERSQDGCQPLLQASRAIRLEAMARLDNLLDALVEGTKRVLAGYDKGEQTYKNLTSE